MTPDEWKRQWASQQTFHIPRYIFDANTEEDVLSNVREILNRHHLFINNYQTATRKTFQGFAMSLHRDYYQFNTLLFKKGIRDESLLWLKIYDGPSPQITAIWYLTSQGDDFNGGNLVFHDGEKVVPMKYRVILFDSNDLHCVHSQGKTRTSRDIMLFTYNVDRIKL